MKRTTKTQIVLPADVYDTIELSALAHDGIGAGRYFSSYGLDGDAVPLCIIGHGKHVEPADSWGNREYVVRDTLRAAGIDEDFNDNLVEAAIAAGVGNGDKRISWAEYTKRGNIVRGNN